jgi:hypothetical protein
MTGANVDRYSFIVMDLHHLLLAGLPAHSCADPFLASFRYAFWISSADALGLMPSNS